MEIFSFVSSEHAGYHSTIQNIVSQKSFLESLKISERISQILFHTVSGEQLWINELAVFGAGYTLLVRAVLFVSA